MTDRHAAFAGSAGDRTPALRIFSYLPNPRVAKATIAARLCGITIEVRGAPPREIAGWLWDFDARPLEAADTSAGSVREARTGFAGTLRKTDAFLSAHPFGAVPAAFSPDGKIGVFESNSIARAVVRLAPARAFLVGDALTLADIVFASELALFSADRASRRVLSGAGLTPLYGEELRETYPRALAHFARLCAHEAFAPDLGPYLEKLDARND